MSKSNLIKGIDYPGISIIYFCHDGQGNFVMARRSAKARDENGCWDIGGGALEIGQTVKETLVKEIGEEYGTKVLNFEFLGYRDVHRINQGKKTHWLALDFKVLVDKNLVKNNEPHKFDQITWFTLNKLPEKIHSQLPQFFKLYQDKLK